MQKPLITVDNDAMIHMTVHGFDPYILVHMLSANLVEVVANGVEIMNHVRIRLIDNM